MGQIAVHHVKIGAADGAGMDTDENLSRRRLRPGHFRQLQGRSLLSQDHGPHRLPLAGFSGVTIRKSHDDVAGHLIKVDSRQDPPTCTEKTAMYHYAYPHPAVATDICIFTVVAADLRLLLIKRAGAPFRGRWALPGGFLKADEDLDSCARRELMEETGVSTSALHQFGIFSDPKRDPRERVISVAYLALVREATAPLAAGSDAAAADWFSVGGLPELAFDHAVIVGKARDALRQLLKDTPAVFALVPEKFTLGQLQAVYEAVERVPLDKRNFRGDIAR